ncbi:hypothetical protein TCON_1618 [Astathelohania contejeani]|uniref:Uncharacterized protein n=1 Tax=Astathelohania contejeani TaxID=164912 RepID=A0ABQ7HYC1_9MICR|nr:hypothetical protein TCON_1618 [Thelohania contejeani]
MNKNTSSSVLGIPTRTNPISNTSPQQLPAQPSVTPTPPSSTSSTLSSASIPLIANPHINPEVSDVLSKIQEMVKHVNNPNQRADFIKTLSHHLNTIGNSSKCVCMHAVFPNLKFEDKDFHLQRLEELYQKAREKSLQNIYKSLSAICLPCLYVKMGLISTEVVKDFHDPSCSSKTGPTHSYNLGPIWHALTSFSVNQKVYPHMQNAMNISFHPGNIIIPDPKIFLQMLAMPSNLLDQGVKVIWVNTPEIIPEGNDQMEIYKKFMEALPDSLDNGYYKGVMPQSNSSKPILETKTIISKPPQEFVKAGKHEEKDVILKIFDVNSVLNIYYSQLIQSQRRLQMKKTSMDNYGSELYLNRTNFGCYAPLSTHRMHDFLAIAIALSDKPEDLKNLPPLNGECITTPHNILIINNEGRAVFTAQTDPQPSPACIKLKRALKDGKNYPPNKRFVHTSHTLTPNITLKPENPTKPDMFPDYSSVSPQFADIAIEKHINDSQMYHKSLNMNKDNLKQYFTEFNDDLNNMINLDTINISTLDIAIGMYPNKILDLNKNSEKPDDIDIFSDHSTDDQNILEITSPNVVYSMNVGFVTLKSLCSNEMLILKNTITFLQNIIFRNTGTNFIKGKNDDPINKTTIFTSPNYFVEIKDPTEYIEAVNKKTAVDTSILPLSQIEPPNLAHVDQDLCNTMSFDQYVQLYTPPNNQGCIW